MPNWDLGCVTSRVAVTSTHDKMELGLRDIQSTHAMLGLGLRDVKKHPKNTKIQSTHAKLGLGLRDIQGCSDIHS